MECSGVVWDIKYYMRLLYTLKPVKKWQPVVVHELKRDTKLNVGV